MEKWKNISLFSDNNSKIFVKHACDCYSSPNRLSIHYKHFKNSMCYYSTQPKGYFYNIINKKWMLYDGYKIEPINWNKYGVSKKKILDSNFIDNPNIKIRGCHLNMALRTDIMKKINLPFKPLKSGLDGYILKNMISIIDLRPEENKIIFSDDEIDKDNWEYSLDTDGYNNISLTRRLLYEIPENNKKWCIPISNDNFKNKIPQYIFTYLNILEKDINNCKIK